MPLLSNLICGLGPTDSRTFVTVCLLLGASSLLASLRPRSESGARRSNGCLASRIARRCSSFKDITGTFGTSCLLFGKAPNCIGPADNRH